MALSGADAGEQKGRLAVLAKLDLSKCSLIDSNAEAVGKLIEAHVRDFWNLCIILVLNRHGGGGEVRHCSGRALVIVR